MSKHMIIWHSNIKDDDNIKIYSQDPSYVVSADRTDLINLKKIEESHKPGIYILSDKLNNRYIGQASHSVLSRVIEHGKKKAWWTEILFFGRDDGKLDKSQLDYLEKKLIKSYADAGFILDNGDVGNKSFIEAYQRGKAESLWENTLQILEDSANIQLFKKTRIPVNPETILKPVVSSKVIETASAKDIVSASDTVSRLEHNKDKPKHSLTDSLGNTVEARSLRRMYINWMKKLVEEGNFKQRLYKIAEEGSAIFRQDEFIDKRNSRWTEKLDEGLYLMVNLDAKTIRARIDKIAERLNIEVEIN